MKTYQHFATVLASLLGNETAVHLTVKGYMPLSIESIGHHVTATTSFRSATTGSNTAT